MLHLSRPDHLRNLLVRSRTEFALAVAVLAGELTIGVLQGIVLGVLTSLLLLIYRASHPNDAVLGQLRGEEAYRDVRLHADAITFPGLLMWRGGGDMFFASIGRHMEALDRALAATRPEPTHVLVDAESVTTIDTTACDRLLTAIRQIQNRGVTIAFARVRDPVREAMLLGGVEAAVGSGNFFDRVTGGVRAWQSQHQSSLSSAAGGPPPRASGARQLDLE